MQYTWNPEFDVFFLHDRADFVALNHEVSFEGGIISKALCRLDSAFSYREAGLTLTDALQALVSFDEQDVNRLWQALLQEDLLKNRELITVQRSPVPRLKRSGACLFDSFPIKVFDDLCSQIGFRFGGVYLLATASEKIPVLDLAKQILEWAFSGKWLDRARPLFWKTDEHIIAGEGFLPQHTRKWLQCVLDALLTTNETNCLYEINLRSLEIRREQLLSSSSAVGVLMPVVQQDDITNNERKVEFTPSFSIVQSRYRQPGVWEGARQHLACGAHPNPWTARCISAAEAVERSAAAAYKVNDLSFGKLEDDPRRVDPRCLIELDYEQRSDGNLHLFDPEQPYYWRAATDLVNGREVQIIADLCYFPFHPPGYDHRFSWGNSSGMAAGQTMAQAQQSALFELIERDAFMIAWITKYSAPRISDSLTPLGIRESSRQLQLIGYDTALLDITVRGVPTVLGVAYRNEWPALVLGAAARNTLLEAIHVAWKEVEVGLYCRLLDPIMKEGNKPQLQAKDVLGANDHAQFYNHPDHLGYASFLWNSSKETERLPEEPYFKGPAEDNIVSLYRQLAIDQLYLVNYGSTCGFQVIRLLTPHLVPLMFGYNQLPRQQVVKSAVQSVCPGVLPDVFRVHPFD